MFTGMGKREAVWNGIKDVPECDVLILGGGVNGTALLRDLSLQGLRCVLVDKGDYAAGASSNSSRMIHGGLRYLENAEFKLVSEALRERNLLLKHAPHYVMPLRTTIPITSRFQGMIKSPLLFFGVPVTPGGRGALIVKMGLMFYDVITGKNRQTPKHFFMSKAQTESEVPGLKEDMICSANYWDAWISHPERMCVDMAREGCEINPRCAALNYVTAERADAEHVRLRDTISAETIDVKPRIVVNATGAWIDYTNRALGLQTEFIGGTKGSHLVIENQELYNALGDRMVYYEHDDGRICITFRFMDKVIMGSTDIRVSDPEDAFCDDAEIEYMLTTLRGVFPKLTLARSDIVYKFCGVRPLPFSKESFTGRVPRAHQLRISEADHQRKYSIYSMIGGKLTSFRAFAEQVADTLLKQLEKEREISTRERGYHGAREFPRGEDAKKNWIKRVAKESGVDQNRVKNLLERYGTKAERFASESKPEWREPLKTMPRYTVGEIGMLAETEQVVHLSDLVRRRTLITLLGNSTEAVLREVAAIVGQVHNWDEARRGREVKAALSEADV